MKPKSPKIMTCQTFKTKMFDLRDQWAADSNATSDPDELKDICAQFIVDMDNLITAAGGHPTDPPPRIRP